jgi:hypothetical protein
MGEKDRKKRDQEPGAIDSAVGEAVSWIAGKDSTKRGKGPTDGAVGSIFSWVTGKGRRKNKD